MPQLARDRIYEDHVRIPNEFYREGSDDDNMIRLPKELAEGLQELTDLQHEVIFRNVINGEPASVIAQEKNCSARNIRDVRARALKALRAAAMKGSPGIGYPDVALFILWSILICAAGYFLLAPDTVEAWIRAVVFIALPIVTVASIVLVV